MKRHNIVTILLLVYTGVMAYIGWDKFSAENDLTSYFALIGASIVVILLLRYVLIRRSKLRSESRKRRDAASRRSHRNDQIH